eukprot:TRINITY_DN1870_c0_g2_i1.p1 TRINITY_DN1870_c0_g2~~TRINITY_DN1870_c0_g2_i1.p1  ORF type:complete len:188 (-),score=46.02 TRINITY_DN1870_c0_g2_i1:51-614(-)
MELVDPGWLPAVLPVVWFGGSFSLTLYRLHRKHLLATEGSTSEEATAVGGSPDLPLTDELTVGNTTTYDLQAKLSALGGDSAPPITTSGCAAVLMDTINDPTTQQQPLLLLPLQYNNESGEQLIGRVPIEMSNPLEEEQLRRRVATGDESAVARFLAEHSGVDINARVRTIQYETTYHHHQQTATLA